LTLLDNGGIPAVSLSVHHDEPARGQGGVYLYGDNGDVVGHLLVGDAGVNLTPDGPHGRPRRRVEGRLKRRGDARARRPARTLLRTNDGTK
jgi:hypothetical protein